LMQRTIKVQSRTLLVQAGDPPGSFGWLQVRYSAAKPLKSLPMIPSWRSRQQLARRLLSITRGRNGVSA
jgi:hypothetical protein